MLLNVVPLNMNDPDAVPPSLNVTPVNVQRIESAEAMLGRDNRASRSTAENTLRIIRRFIIPPSLRCRLTRTLLQSMFHLSLLITSSLPTASPSLRNNRLSISGRTLPPSELGKPQPRLALLARKYNKYHCLSMFPKASGGQPARLRSFLQVFFCSRFDEVVGPPSGPAATTLFARRARQAVN